jgi:L-rhamnose isomerase / sugar isomerase
MAAHRLLKTAYNTDVSALMCEVRKRKGGALHPWACYRASGYRQEKTKERPAVAGSSSGIV